MFLQQLVSVFAATQAECDAEKARTFLGITKWYKYLPYHPDVLGNCAIDLQLRDPTGAIHLDKLLLIALAVVDMLLRISVLVAIGFVVYGGIRYITSQGEPENTKAARGTIINALIGMAIAIIATVVVSFIGHQLGG